MPRLAGLAALGVAVVAGMQSGALAGPGPRQPRHTGRLTLQGRLRDGSTVTAAGVHWTAVPGSQQSVSYSWEACTARRCAALSVPVHQPYLPSALLGPDDVGKHLRVSETAVDVLASGKETHATVSYRSKRAVAAWPRGVSPRIDFVYGVPESESASTRELFDLSPPFANRADGRVTVACRDRPRALLARLRTFALFHDAQPEPGSPHRPSAGLKRCRIAYDLLFLEGGGVARPYRVLVLFHAAAPRRDRPPHELGLAAPGPARLP